MFSLDFITADMVIGAAVGGVVGAGAGYYFGKEAGRKEAEKGVGLKQLESMKGDMDEILSSMEKRMASFQATGVNTPVPVVPTSPAAPAPVVVVEQAHSTPVTGETPPDGFTWFEDGGKRILMPIALVQNGMTARIQELEAQLAHAKAKTNHNGGQHHNNQNNQKQKNQNHNNSKNQNNQKQETAKVVHVADDNIIGNAMVNAGVVNAAT